MMANCFQVILKAIENIVEVRRSLNRSLFFINHRFYDIQLQLDSVCSNHKCRRSSRDDFHCRARNKHRNIKD